MSGPAYVSLPARGLIRIAGADRFDFLQGLVSNDIAPLREAAESGRPAPPVYACLLNAHGKFLHDFFMSTEGDAVLLDCEGGARAQDLARRFAIYKLRAAISVSAEESAGIFAVLPPAGAQLEDALHADPRHPVLGLRLRARPAQGEEKPFAEWDRLRISFAIPDGSRDMKIEDSTLIECGIDRLNGISFTKGCYVGQELTARMKHRGLAKKHLYALEFAQTPPAPGSELSIGGKFAGEMRSSCGNRGLALLKDEYAAKAEEIGARAIETGAA
jgi:folate-binding protein YgfZ